MDFGPIARAIFALPNRTAGWGVATPLFGLSSVKTVLLAPAMSPFDDADISMSLPNKSMIHQLSPKGEPGLEDWLRSIGLGQHAAAYRDNGITFDLLDKLTEQDLKELGLTIGERKRFLEAVAKRQTASAAEPAVSLPGERRPLTVMFVDLVGSTPLGERVDAEDLLEINRLYRELCGAAIGRYGGSIARFLGDGILAYFCYPVANENDPERAVRAAVEIVQGIGGLKTPAKQPLQARLGIATGRVVVSDLAAGGLEEKQGVTGSIPNEAARLQSLAGPNGIVVNEQTYARIASRFLCEPLGSLEVRGFERPLHPARVIGERPADSRPGLSPSVTILPAFTDEMPILRSSARGGVAWRWAKAALFL